MQNLEKEKLGQAMRKYLKKNLCIEACTDKDVFDHLENLNKIEKRGIWQFVGELLHVDPEAAKNYYHNTWCRQFFDKLGGC